jgi:hypothetical protein
VEHGYGSYFGSLRKNPLWGSRGLALLGCLPHWGREGVTFAISTSAQENSKGFLQSRKFIEKPDFLKKIVGKLFSRWKKKFPFLF